MGKSITLPSGESATVIESEAGDLVLAIPDTSTGSLPMTLEAAENPEQRSRIEEEARRLGLIYFTPSEILLIQDTWNEAIERGGMNAPQAHIDMTDGIGLFERSSYLSFRRFLQQIQRRI